MSLTSILTAVSVVGGVGLFIGLFLGIAAIKFHVEVDEKEEAVLAALPGNNCGGCGFAGCAGLAAAIAVGDAAVNACPVGGDAVGEIIAGIMGVEAKTGVREVAFVKCGGTCDKTAVDYEYHGIQDCTMLSFIPNGGAKTCNEGCLGYGSCVKICPFDAIQIENGIAVVNKEKCKACGKCVAECPKHIIEMVPYKAKHLVLCSSRDKGPLTMKACQTGCIACGICVKVCPVQAVSITDFHAHIDQEKCIGCGICQDKCPRKIIC